jgi:hypothetical protein
MMGFCEHSDEHLGFVRVRHLFTYNCKLLKEDYDSRVMASLRPLDASLSPWRPEFNRRVVYVGFVINKVAIKQVFLQVLRLCPADYYLTNVSFQNTVRGL